MRYDARITVVVSFDASTQKDARETAAQLADTVSVKTPPGRDAEFVRALVSRLIPHNG